MPRHVRLINQTPRVKSHPATPYIFVVSRVTAKTFSPSDHRRSQPRMIAADETGTGAVPDMAEVLRAYRVRNRR